MRYIKIENNSPIDYTIEQLFQDYPDAVIYKTSQMPNEQLLANYDVYPLITTTKPDGDVVTEGIPELIGKEWNQTWISRPFTEEEKLQNQKELKEQESKLFVANAVAEERYNICQSCDNFNKLTTLCKECSCIMLLKTKLQSVNCPINKW
jgi:hypothetical protein